MSRRALLAATRALLLLVLLALDLAAARAQVGWPVPSAWKAVRDRSFSSIRDLTGDESPPTADLSSRGARRAVGDMDSVFWHSDGQILFCRFLLSGNPLSGSGTNWSFNSNASYVVLVDANHDNVSDFSINASKQNAVRIYQGSSSTPLYDIANGAITPSGSPPVYTSASGLIRVTDLGIVNPGTSERLHYLDVQIPLSLLPGVTATSFVRPYLGTATNDNNINKDFMIQGASSVNFDDVAGAVLGDPSRLGALYDSRDTAPSSSAGTWLPGETVQITGYGWPPGATIPVQIVSPDGVTVVWSGNVVTDASGNIPATVSWLVPQNVSGVYRIFAGYPAGSAYVQYDTFTVVGPTITAVKSVDKATAARNDLLTYTITYGNTGSAAGNVTITDSIPGNTTFVSASKTDPSTTITYQHVAGGAFDTSSAGTVVAVRYTRSALAAGVTGLTATLQVRVNTTTPDATVVTNTAGVAVNNVTVLTPSASTTVRVPILAASKATDKTSATRSEAVTYTLTYGNTGTGDATNVVLTDAIPANTTFIPGSATGTGTTITYSHNGGTTFDTSSALPVTHIRWTRATLPAGATGQTLTFQVRVNSDVTQGTAITNSATMGADNVSSITTNAVTTTVILPNLTVTKAVDKNTALSGDALTYTITYGNTGTGDATNVVITDAIPSNTTFIPGSATGTGTTITYSHNGGSTFDTSSALPVTHIRWARTTLATGTTGQTLTFQARVNSGVAQGTAITNAATLGADNVSSVTSNTVTTTVVVPVLSLTKAVDKSQALSGDALTYTLTYGNTGTASATNAIITDAIPANTTFIPGSATGTGVTITYSHNGGTTFDTSSALPVTHIRWTRATLPAGTTGQTLTFQARLNSGVAQGTAITNSATMAADNVSSVTTNTVTTTVVVPVLSSTKAVDKSQALSGDALTYTITYGNTGTASATNLVLTDTIPANATFIPGSATGTGTTITYSHNGGTTFDSSNALPVTHIRWTRTTLATGSTGQSLTFQVRVNSGLAQGTAITNSATAGADNVSSVTSNTVTTTVVVPVLSLTKAVDKSQALSGDALTYTVTYGNTGTGDATNAVITDAIPANTTFIPGSATGTGTTITYSHNGGSTFDTSSALPVTHVRWTRATLPAGTTGQTLTFQVRVQSTLADQTVLTNSAAIQADAISAISSNSITTTVREPLLALTKAVDKTQAAPGSVLTYTVTYVNNGGAAAYNAEFIDVLSDDLAYVQNSAIGAGATIQFQHTNGGAFDTSQSAPVIAIKWTLPGPIAPGATGTLRFQARIR